MRPHPEHLVGESLADAIDAREIQDHVGTPVEPLQQPLGLGPMTATVASNAGLGLVEA